MCYFCTCCLQISCNRVVTNWRVQGQRCSYSAELSTGRKCLRQIHQGVVSLVGILCCVLSNTVEFVLYLLWYFAFWCGYLFLWSRTGGVGVTFWFGALLSPQFIKSTGYVFYSGVWGCRGWISTPNWIQWSDTRWWVCDLIGCFGVSCVLNWVSKHLSAKKILLTVLTNALCVWLCVLYVACVHTCALYVHLYSFICSVPCMCHAYKLFVQCTLIMSC